MSIFGATFLLLFFYASCCPDKEISCPCGTTKQNFTICSLNKKISCEKWKNCESCLSNLNKCLSCPKGTYGLWCDQDKRTEQETEKINSRTPRFFLNSMRDALSRALEYKKMMVNKMAEWAVDNLRKKSTTTMPMAACHCFNGGLCNNKDGNCLCPSDFTGKFCETDIMSHQKKCEDPGFVLGSQRINLDGTPAFKIQEFTQGHSLVFKCQNELLLIGSPIITCTKSGFWTPSLPQCKPLTIQGTMASNETSDIGICPDPGFVYHSDRKKLDGTPSTKVESFKVNDKLIYVCHKDFALYGFSYLVCQDSGSWSVPLPKCRRVNTQSKPNTCPDIGQVPNADRIVLGSTRDSRRLNEFDMEMKVQFKCHPGFYLHGSSILRCLPTGKWSKEKPSCLSTPMTRMPDNGNICIPPPSIENGWYEIVLPDQSRSSAQSVSFEYPQGTEIIYQCHKGFTLSGPKKITCLSNAEWDKNHPRCLVACGTNTIREIPITNGNKTIIGQWPWVVAIAKTNKYDSSIVCGATLLDHRTVITAAHCLENLRLNNTLLYFGKYYRYDYKDDEFVEDRSPSEFIVHHNYTNATYDSDIALIRFEPPIDYSIRIRPVCLPEREYTSEYFGENDAGIVTGWGLTEKHLGADYLKMADIPIHPLDTCRKAYRELNYNLTLTRNMLCAGYEEGQVGPCTGDSGGGFYEIGISKLLGIVSFGLPGQCSLPKKYTIFTNVGNYLPWIWKYMRTTDGPKV